jgi:hypothetical protein
MSNQLNLDNQLQLGDIVGSTNRMVIASTKRTDRVPGDTYATWITICYKEGEHHPYVVWTVIARPEGFSAESGDYCSTLEQAFSAYKERGGNS